MNPLYEWEVQHAQWIRHYLDELGIVLVQDNIPLIVEACRFKILSRKCPEKCPYYEIGEPCHNDVPDLNCFLCACPEYLSGNPVGGCGIGSKKGKWYKSPGLPAGKVWDCSLCSHAHSPHYVTRFLERNINYIREHPEEPFKHEDCFNGIG